MAFTIAWAKWFENTEMREIRDMKRGVSLRLTFLDTIDMQRKCEDAALCFV